VSESLHETFAQLRKPVLEGLGTTTPEERERMAAWSGNPDQGPANQQFPEPLATLLNKVARYAYKVTDEDVQALLDAGYSEDAVFEAILSAALGTAVARYERGLAALRATKGAGDASSGA
jgi:alkylhydroperoxidase family enzyme